MTEDDGLDPRRFFDRRTDSRFKNGRKSFQLCEQVKVALHAILASSRDDAIRSLTVLAVTPAPHTGRLKVAVAVPEPADATDQLEDVQARIDRAAGWIRTEVAAAIHRRKAPELSWQVESMA